MPLFHVPGHTTYTDAALMISTPFGPLRMVIRLDDQQLPIADTARMAGNDDRYLVWELDGGEVGAKFLEPRPEISRDRTLTAVRAAVFRFELTAPVTRLTLFARYLGGLTLEGVEDGVWTDDTVALSLGGAGPEGAKVEHLSDGLRIDVDDASGTLELHVAAAWAPNDPDLRDGPRNPAAEEAIAALDPSEFD
ncbi:MAG: hypothetical protein GY913_28290 [Proteobacteria bacterium]|nr:hypothetical protein [Pseudomonadota bacterium]MCP4920812.1 hypothetical protein [Pseudomonadota bacterium]